MVTAPVMQARELELDPQTHSNGEPTSEACAAPCACPSPLSQHSTCPHRKTVHSKYEQMVMVGRDTRLILLLPSSLFQLFVHSPTLTMCWIQRPHQGHSPQKPHAHREVEQLLQIFVTPVRLKPITKQHLASLVHGTCGLSLQSTTLNGHKGTVRDELPLSLVFISLIR